MLRASMKGNQGQRLDQSTSERQRAAEFARGYELLARSSRDIILFIRRRDGLIIKANDAALLAYGYSQDEMLAQTIHTLRGPSGRARTAVEMEAADSTGILFETEQRRKDGTVFPVEVSVQGMTVGGERILLSVNRDITERRRTEQGLRELHEAVLKEKDFLSALVNSISDEIWFADPKGKIMLVNPSGDREFGLSTTGAADIRALAGSLEIYRADGSPRPTEAAPPLRALRGEEVRNEEELVRTPGTCELRYRQVNSTPVKEIGRAHV